MPEPWKCPACLTWLAPHVESHRCDPDGGVTADRPQPAPEAPPATAGAPHWMWTPEQIATAGTAAFTDWVSLSGIPHLPPRGDRAA